MTAAGEDGGFAVMTEGETKIIFRHPRFKFRPSHNLTAAIKCRDWGASFLGIGSRPVFLAFQAVQLWPAM